MAPCDDDCAVVIHEAQDDMGPRMRKFSESYREIEAVDSNDDLMVIRARTRTQSSELSEKPILEDASDEREDSSDEEIMSLPSSSLDVETSFVLAKIATDAPEPDQYDETFLRALPVTMATSEVRAKDLSLPTATTVIRIKASPVPTHRSARRISVKVYKPTKESKLGIRLSLSNDGHLQLAHVSGFLKESPLRAGDELSSINGQDVSAWTTTKALQYLRESWGWVSLTVRNPNCSSGSLTLASVRKSSQTDKLGISFRTEANKLTVNGLNVAGLLGFVCPSG